MLMIGNWPKGFPLRSKVIDYLSPPTGKHAGILTYFQTKVKEKVLYKHINSAGGGRNEGAGQTGGRTGWELFGKLENLQKKIICYYLPQI